MENAKNSDWQQFNPDAPPDGMCWWYWNHRITGGRPQEGVFRKLPDGSGIIEQAGFVFNADYAATQNLRYIQIQPPKPDESGWLPIDTTAPTRDLCWWLWDGMEPNNTPICGYFIPRHGGFLRALDIDYNLSQADKNSLRHLPIAQPTIIK